MAVFNYEYTQRELYDWVVTEISVAREMGMDNLTTFLDLFQKPMNQQNQDRGQALWIPSVPTADSIRQVKSHMRNFSRTVLYKIGDTVDDTADVPFTGHSGKCPECLLPKAHLKAHLMSQKHEWTRLNTTSGRIARLSHCLHIDRKRSVTTSPLRGRSVPGVVTG